jgi:hypothetical protein
VYVYADQAARPSKLRLADDTRNATADVATGCDKIVKA